jgi:hypothetical protein
LAGGDDLAVRGLEVEAELARVILADLELGRYRFSLDRARKCSTS